jgi:hypothetical protein
MDRVFFFFIFSFSFFVWMFKVKKIVFFFIFIIVIFDKFKERIYDLTVNYILLFYRLFY